MAEQHNRKFKGRYDFCTFYLVPGVTILLTSRGDLSETNLSVLGGMLENRLAVGLWGLLVGTYCCAYMLYLFRIGHYRHGIARVLMIVSAVLFFLSFMVPYVPEKYPAASSFHVLFAFCSTVLFSTGIACFLHSQSKKDRQKFWRAWYVLWLLTVCALLLFLCAGFITSFLEIFIVLSLCGFMRYMERLLTPDMRVGWEES